MPTCEGGYTGVVKLSCFSVQTCPRFDAEVFWSAGGWLGRSPWPRGLIPAEKMPRSLAGVFRPIARFFVGFGIREILFSKIYGAGLYEGTVFSKSVMVAGAVLYRAYSFAIGGLSLLNSVSA
jgi:hypothetical protein